MKANPEKCHQLINATTSTTMKTKENEILDWGIEKLPGVISISVISIIIYTKYFKKNLEKVHILTKVTSYISIPQTKLQINAFFTSHCNYFPLVWMSSMIYNGKASSDYGHHPTIGRHHPTERICNQQL